MGDVLWLLGFATMWVILIVLIVLFLKGAEDE